MKDRLSEIIKNVNEWEEPWHIIYILNIINVF